jgi:hypothetical protein
MMTSGGCVEPEPHVRVYVRFHDGRARTDKVHALSKLEARLDAYSHARALIERPDVENAFLLNDDEPDEPDSV